MSAGVLKKLSIIIPRPQQEILFFLRERVKLGCSRLYPVTLFSPQGSDLTALRTAKAEHGYQRRSSEKETRSKKYFHLKERDNNPKPLKELKELPQSKHIHDSVQLDCQERDWQQDPLVDNDQQMVNKKIKVDSDECLSRNMPAKPKKRSKEEMMRRRIRERERMREQRMKLRMAEKEVVASSSSASIAAPSDGQLSDLSSSASALSREKLVLFERLQRIRRADAERHRRYRSNPEVATRLRKIDAERHRMQRQDRRLSAIVSKRECVVRERDRIRKRIERQDKKEAQGLSFELNTPKKQKCKKRPVKSCSDDASNLIRSLVYSALTFDAASGDHSGSRSNSGDMLEDIASKVLQQIVFCAVTSDVREES